MSYFIEQKIKDHVYVYEVQAYWDKDKQQARQKRKYIGKKDISTGEVTTPQKSVLPRTVCGYGINYVLDQIAADIGLKKILKKHFGVDGGNQILAFLYFKISEANPSYLFEHWSKDNYLPFTVKETRSPQLSLWMRQLSEDEGCCTAFLRAWTRHHTEDHGVWFDITSVSSYGTQNNFLEWGYNRDGESLPQINLGMIMGGNSRLPLSYEVYPGSISDVATLKNTVLKQKAWRSKIKTFILDRGFYSASNIELMYKEGIHFVMPLPGQVKQAQVLLNETKHELESPLSSILFEGEALFAVKRTYELNGQTMYATIFFDQKRYSDESMRFYKRLNEIEQYIHDGTFYNLPQVEEALESSWLGSSRYFNITFIDNNKVKLTRKRNALSWRINRMGKMILVSDQDWNDLDLLTWYRQRDSIEKAFDLLKNELDEQRLRVHSAETMHGKLFLNFLSTVLYAAMLNKISDAGLNKNYSLPEILAYLKKWRLVNLSNGKSVFTEISKKQREILALLKISVPVHHSY